MSFMSGTLSRMETFLIEFSTKWQSLDIFGKKASRGFTEDGKSSWIPSTSNSLYHAKYHESSNKFEIQQGIRKYLVTLIKYEIYHCTLVTVTAKYFFHYEHSIWTSFDLHH